MAILLGAFAAWDVAQADQSKLIPVAGRAVYGEWHSSCFGGGGYVQGVVLCPSDAKRLYAYGDVFGVFRSDDGGTKWRMLHGSLPISKMAHYSVRGLVVDPRRADHILIATGQQWAPMGGLFLSEDGGATWRKVLDAQFYGNEKYRAAGVVLARNPKNPDEILAASGGTGVWKSTDNGATWNKVGLDGIWPVDLVYDASNGNRIWLSAQSGSLFKNNFTSGFYRSDDGGTKWKKLSVAAPTEMVQSPKNPEVLYGIFDEHFLKMSSNGGQTWTDLGEGLPSSSSGKASSLIASNRFNAIAVGPDFVVTASSRGEFWKLPFGTTTWQSIPMESVEEVYEGKPWYGRMAPGRFQHFGAALGSITIDPRDPQHWFFTDWYALYQTHDQGANWKLSMDGIEATVVHCLTQDAKNPATVHLGMGDNGYLISTDGGNRFAQPESYFASNIKSIAAASGSSGKLYATGDRTSGTWVANQVFLSDDDGQSWSRSSMTGLPNPEMHHYNAIAVDPAEANRVYLAASKEVQEGKGGIYCSEDGGQNWKWEGQGLPAGGTFFSHDIWICGQELACGQGGTRVALSGIYKSVYYWNKNENQWKRSAYPGESPGSVAAAVNPEGHFYIADQNSGVLESVDGGATWTIVYRGKAKHVAVDRNNPDRIAAGMEEGVAVSLDGGKTWTLTDAALPYRYYPIPAFCGDRVVVGTAGNGAFWISIPEAGSKSTAKK